MITIIAEAGVNHNGSLDMAKLLVDVAAEAGADYVKFQTFKAEKLVTHAARQAEYQKKNIAASINDRNEDKISFTAERNQEQISGDSASGLAIDPQERISEKGDSQLEMLKKLELSEDDHRELIAYCASRGIKFLSTPFDSESMDFLHSLGMPLWKIPSGEISNYPYLRKIAGYNGEVVMSTGMCEPEDIRMAIDSLINNGQDINKVTLLHCNTQYPTPMEDVNLNAMNALRKFVPRVGFSDHTQGIEVPIAAAALGAEVIEKHFTLSRDLPGPDHRASLEPDELKSMVRAVRNIEKALGSAEKHVTPSEKGNREVARKSIVASRHIRKGEILSDENMTAKRPGTGISPMRWLEVEGTAAIRDFEPDEMIEV